MIFSGLKFHRPGLVALDIFIGGYMGNRLYIGNINFKATEDDLSELFSQAGSVVSTKLITDAVTGRPRGFGFVEMSSDEEAEKAIGMFNGNDFMERKLVVNEARPREQRR
jgi:RNA recognition motif-containing protein